MPTIRLATFTVLILCSGTGCATVINVGDDTKLPFGGTLLDGAALTLPIAALDDKPDKFDFKQSCLIASMALVDLPFSVVGDVLTLPYTVPVTIWRGYTEKAEQMTTENVSSSAPAETPEKRSAPTADHNPG